MRPVKSAVIGAGSWGTTVAALVAPKHPTMLWARSPDVAKTINTEHVNRAYLTEFTLPAELRATSDMEEAVADADILIVGVPTTGFRSILEQTLPYIRPWIPVVSLAKGLERGTLMRMSEVVKEVLPGHPSAVLTGPNIAREILHGKAAASVLATEDLAVASALQAHLTRGLFRVYVNDDVVGCEIGGALKNVVAIAAGIGQGLDVGDNTRAAVISRGLAELSRLAMAMGAQAMTLAGLAGMGDLIATCMSPHSRNRAVGEALGRGRPLDEILSEMQMVAEGVNTAALALELGARHGVELPICSMIHRVILGELAPADAYFGLRRPGHEAEPD